ncbi:MAG: peroxidase family protein, partial [Pseudomonadota bacterium]
MATLIKTDLEFILQQILISEAHAAGTPLQSLIPNATLPWGLRTVDGTYNNIVPGRSEFGAADNTFPRLTTPVFRGADPLPFDPDGPGPLQAGDATSYQQTSGLVIDSQPRVISNLIVDQTLTNTAAVVAALERSGSANPTADAAAIAAADAATKAAAAAAATAQAAENAAAAAAASSNAAAITAAQAAADAQALADIDAAALAAATAASNAADLAAADAAQTAINAQAAEDAAALNAATSAAAALAAAQAAADALTLANADALALVNATAASNAADSAAAAAAQAALDAQAAEDAAALTAATSAAAALAAAQAAADAQALADADATTLALATAASDAADLASADALAALNAVLADPASTPEQIADAQAVYDAAAQAALDAQAAEDTAALAASVSGAAAAAAIQAATDAQALADADALALANATAASDAADLTATDAAQAALDAQAAEDAAAAAAGASSAAAAAAAQAAADAQALADIDAAALAAATVASDAADLAAASAAQVAADAQAVEDTAALAANISATTATAAAQTALAAQALADADALALVNATAASNAADASAANAANTFSTLLAGFGFTADGPLFIPNVTPDQGLSAPFNSWFTLFGQFFDHGLDLVNKGGSGTVFVPLQPDDPLFNAGADGIPHTADDGPNFMVLTRATNRPGPDGVLGTADDIRQHVNQTTPFVDQNQTYTSHPSHQVFLREYALDASGQPVATGRLLDGATGGLATWADVKAQARDLLGINLTDADVTNLPLLATDEYGRFLRGPNGFAQIVEVGPDGLPGTADDVLVEGNPAAPISTANAVRTGHAFLDDIAHSAAPRTSNGAMKTADADSVIGDDHNPATYDDELLNAHFATGDGRGNENIGLTAVHHVFHSEHNRQVDAVKATVLASGDAAFISQWQLPDGSWNGERLFQAARFATEMEYQHLVFEEFARKVQPQVNVFAGYQIEIDPAIVAEFAHTVYRFGHSMLTETVARTNPDGTPNDIGLIEAFLNPLEFTASGAGADAAAGAIVRGMTRQVGNEIDEFVTGALRSNLLGLPLDLATINLTRGRDTGIPSLNAARQQFYTSTSDPQLAPYTSWVDFGLNIKHPESLVNFIAAYGTHGSITGAATLAAKRDAALLLVAGDADLDGDGIVESAPLDRLDFLNSAGTWAAQETGLNLVDFWIGGLAERQMPFGGLLGSTFNFVFETQLEMLQDGDRFYYLARTAGLNFLTQLEQNSFAELVTLNTQNAGRLPGDIFSRPDFILEVDQTQQFTGLGPTGNADPAGLVLRDNPATPGPDANYLRFIGGEHVVLGGTNGNDILIAGIGDDTIWGDGGNDRIEGGAGNDMLIGGAGDDIITDIFGDDNIKGGAGNDVINAGAGLDLILAGDGNDFVVAGIDLKETFGGGGNDFIIAGNGADTVLGNEGDDWIEGGSQGDVLLGDNNNPFEVGATAGNDVLIGDGGDDDHHAESGDDIMVAGPGVDFNEGMLGFDWVTYKNDPQAADADMLFNGLLPPTIGALRDQFNLVEGLSGWNLHDILRGEDRTADQLTLIDPLSGHNNALNNAGQIALINGLQGLLGTGVTSFGGGNIILGGDGSDIIEGRGGNDILDGDRWLNVQLEAPNLATGGTKRVNSMTEVQADMFAGRINPGQLTIIREILTANGANDTDYAVYSDIRDNYTVTANLDGSFTVAHNAPLGVANNGIDTLWNIERLQFADVTEVIAGNNALATGAPVISDTTPIQNQLLTVDLSSIADPDGIAGGLGSIALEWQSSPDGILWTRQAIGSTFTPGALLVNEQLRVIATFTDGLGGLEVLMSTPTAPVVLGNRAPVGTVVINDTTPAQDQLLTATNAFTDADGL